MTNRKKIQQSIIRGQEREKTKNNKEKIINEIIQEDSP